MPSLGLTPERGIFTYCKCPRSRGFENLEAALLPPFLRLCWLPLSTSVCLYTARPPAVYCPPPYSPNPRQVLRYGPTNKYGPHMDGLERVMSVLIYLVGERAGGLAGGSG